MEKTTYINSEASGIKNMTSIKTESSSSSETTESVRPREMVSDPSKEMLEEEEEEGETRGMELDCSSCLLQEQMKEGNYELVSKVAKSWDLGVIKCYQLVSSE